MNFDKNNYLIFASSKGDTDKNTTGEGVVGNHAYSVLSVHDIMVEDENIRLLRLRNPWGHQEWQGDWSDKSDLWTPALR